MWSIDFRYQFAFWLTKKDNSVKVRNWVYDIYIHVLTPTKKDFLWFIWILWQYFDYMSSIIIDFIHICYDKHIIKCRKQTCSIFVLCWTWPNTNVLCKPLSYNLIRCGFHLLKMFLCIFLPPLSLFLKNIPVIIWSIFSLCTELHVIQGTSTSYISCIFFFFAKKDLQMVIQRGPGLMIMR